MSNKPPKDENNQEESEKNKRIKTLSKVVCICNGINLGKVLSVLDECEYVADVNSKIGTGTGGCKGERCGPRLKILIKKNAARKEKD